MSSIKKLNQSESGIASLMITLILMIVISLIVLGFAQVARREERGSLDRQLSTQAFYAAESGVNDVKALLQSIPAGNIQVKKHCLADTTEGSYSGLDYTLNNGTNVSYSCILVTPYVQQLVKQPLDADTDWVVPVVPVTSTGGASNLGTLNVQWTPEQGHANPTAGCQVANPVTTGRSCGYSLIRFEIVPTDTLSRAALTSQDKVFFLYPTTAASSTVNFSSATGTQVSAACGSTCNVTISGLSGHANYYVRAHALYTGTNMTIKGQTTSNSSVNFSGAQAQIDSTGKAQDVLRRVRVSYSLTSGENDSYAQYAVNSRDSLCKRFAIAPGVTLPTSALDSTNKYCGAAASAATSSGGDAAVDEVSCTYGAPGCFGYVDTTWHFDAVLINKSDNPQASVQSCSWHWDDGTPDTSGPASNPANACYYGDQISHVMNGGPVVYTAKPPLALCRNYNVVLTMHFVDGTSVNTTYPHYDPYGAACP